MTVLTAPQIAETRKKVMRIYSSDRSATGAMTKDQLTTMLNNLSAHHNATATDIRTAAGPDAQHLTDRQILQAYAEVVREMLETAEAAAG